MTDRRRPRIAILGTNGVPARYGGFETLAEQIVRAAAEAGLDADLSVTCRPKRRGAPSPATWQGARLKYLPVPANGAASVLHDGLALLWAMRTRQDAVLLLGVSGAVFLPVLRRFSSMRVVVHVDGVEWRRPKWTGLARAYLERAERWAVRAADTVISDNAEITRYLHGRYGCDPVEITYGSDGATGDPDDLDDLSLPPRFALSVARIEPENNIDLILETFATRPQEPLVVMGNWTASAYGRDLKARFGRLPHFHLLPPDYRPARLHAMRARADLYIHGHSAGGTNPSLVEVMPYGIPIAAFDCGFNRETTRNAAVYFRDIESLAAAIVDVRAPSRAAQMGAALADIAKARYRWRDVTDAYFQVLGLRDGLSPPE